MSYIESQIKNTPFLLFQGHSASLGHYFKHLYQTVNYVANQDKQIIDEKEKLGYLRLLRGQLSNQEQSLLYLNYLSGFGRKWENGFQNYFSDYLMIHNLPIKEVEYATDPKKEFEKQIISKKLNEGLNMFEDYKYETATPRSIIAE